MSVIEHIKKILARKDELEEMIKNRKSALNCNHEGTNAFIVGPSSAGSGHRFHLKWDEVAPLVENSIVALQAELDSINKKVDAIGALMGAE